MALVSNVGATPAGAYYSVVYQLGAGEVENGELGGADNFSSELGVGTNDAGIGIAAAPVSLQYVNRNWRRRRMIMPWCTSTQRRPSAGQKISKRRMCLSDEYKRSGDQGICRSESENVGAGNYLPTAADDERADYAAGKSGTPMQDAPKNMWILDSLAKRI